MAASKQEVGRRLREARTARGKTQQEIADALNVTEEAYGHYERGKGDMAATMLSQVAPMLEVTADWLLGLSAIGPDEREKRQIIDAAREGGRQAVLEALDAAFTRMAADPGSAPPSFQRLLRREQSDGEA